MLEILPISPLHAIALNFFYNLCGCSRVTLSQGKKTVNAWRPFRFFPASEPSPHSLFQGIIVFKSVQQPFPSDCCKESHVSHPKKIVGDKHRKDNHLFMARTPVQYQTQRQGARLWRFGSSSGLKFTPKSLCRSPDKRLKWPLPPFLRNANSTRCSLSI